MSDQLKLVKIANSPRISWSEHLMLSVIVLSLLGVKRRSLVGPVVRLSRKFSMEMISAILIGFHRGPQYSSLLLTSDFSSVIIKYWDRSRKPLKGPMMLRIIRAQFQEHEWGCLAGLFKPCCWCVGSTNSRQSLDTSTPKSLTSSVGVITISHGHQMLSSWEVLLWKVNFSACSCYFCWGCS